MCSTSIIDLPIEIIEDFIFPLLTDEDIKSCGKTKIKRLKDIVDDYLRNNRCKSICYWNYAFSRIIIIINARSNFE